MPESDRDEDQIANVTAASSGIPEQPEPVVEEEEKVLAGRPDANMPALLTKDVLGG